MQIVRLFHHLLVGVSCSRYGVMLEKFQKHDPSVMGRIRGCVVDSAPVAAPDPQVNDNCTSVTGKEQRLSTNAC